MGRAPKRLWAYTKPQWLCLSSYAIVRLLHTTQKQHMNTHIPQYYTYFGTLHPRLYKKRSYWV